MSAYEQTVGQAFQFISWAGTPFAFAVGIGLAFIVGRFVLSLFGVGGSDSSSDGAHSGVMGRRFSGHPGTNGSLLSKLRPRRGRRVVYGDKEWKRQVRDGNYIDANRSAKASGMSHDEWLAAHTEKVGRMGGE